MAKRLLHRILVSAITIHDHNPLSFTKSIFRPQRNLHQIPRSGTLEPPSSSSMSLVAGTTSESLEEEDLQMNEFLSRFVFKMRKKIRESYPDIEREVCNGMLVVISQKLLSMIEKKGDLFVGLSGSVVSLAEDPEVALSPHLWTTAWDLSGSIIQEMRRNRKRELMRRFLHSDDVKGMCRFAAEVGIRGDMLREFRFKWAQEEMEEWEFFQQIRQTAEEAKWRGEMGEKGQGGSMVDNLPERKGKIKYRIYGLDLSDPKWTEVANKVEDSEKRVTPDQIKPISGKCKLITENILGLGENDDPSELLREWADLLEPKRVDWMGLLQMINHYNPALYLKIAELLLSENSFEASIRDYARLMEAHAEADRMDDAERILGKMTEKEIEPDILVSILLVHMYSKAGNIKCAREQFESLRKQGFQADHKLYKSMIKAYLKAGEGKAAGDLMSEMEGFDMKPPEDIYTELLQLYSECGQADEAQKMVNRMQFAGIQQTLESSTLLVEAYSRTGDSDRARNSFDYMIRSGMKPDDRCCAAVISAYAKRNLLDKALDLLFNLEKDGFKPGIATYTVLVDWFCKLLLVDEVEQLLEKIAEKGELPIGIHASLCVMYLRGGIEDKALKSLEILLAKKELVNGSEFEKAIDGLVSGGFIQEAKRVYVAMKESGFDLSDSIKMALMAADAMPLSNMKRGK